MFSIKQVETGRGTLQYREERFTGLRCRISPERSQRHIDQELHLPADDGNCPFCPAKIFSVTPVFADGTRIVQGESVTFPNLYPFGAGHVVTVITREHFTNHFSRQQIIDTLSGQVEALCRFDGYPSINWNFLPSAGASMIHPHMQGLSDFRPSIIVKRYLSASRHYRKKYDRNYWDAVKEAEMASDRYLFGDEIFWSAHGVPVGEREIRGILPITYLDEMENYIDETARGILEILALYRKLGTHAFNMSIFFDKAGKNNGFRAICSLISRINPNQSSTSDTAFMERLHLEPVILTLPEELGKCYKKGKM